MTRGAPIAIERGQLGACLKQRQGSCGARAAFLDDLPRRKKKRGGLNRSPLWVIDVGAGLSFARQARSFGVVRGRLAVSYQLRKASVLEHDLQPKLNLAWRILCAGTGSCGPWAG